MLTQDQQNLPPHVQNVLQSLDDQQGQDIVCIDVHQTSSVADFLIICSSKSHRHARSLAKEILDNYPKEDAKPKIEGEDFSEWILIDLDHTIVHIMLPQVRAYYNLEKLWDKHLGDN